MTTNIIREISACKCDEISRALCMDIGLEELEGKLLLVELTKNGFETAKAMRQLYKIGKADIAKYLEGEMEVKGLGDLTALQDKLCKAGYEFLISDIYITDLLFDMKIPTTACKDAIRDQIAEMSSMHPYERQMFLSADRKRVILIPDRLVLFGEKLAEDEELPIDSLNLRKIIDEETDSDTKGETSGSPTSTPPESTKASGTGFRRLLPSFPLEKNPDVFKDDGVDSIALARLNTILEEINEQDAYNVEKAILGKLERNQYLILPTKYKKISHNEKHIGLKCHPIPASEFIKIAAMNHERLGGTAETRYIGIMRAFMVEHGFHNLGDGGVQKYMSHNEIVYSDKKLDRKYIEEIAHLMADNNNLELLYNLQTLAVLAPIMANEVFLKTGHHWLDNASYKEMYDRLFKACVLGNMKDILPYSVLFHVAIHWVGPYTMRLAWANTMANYTLPPALAIRFNSAPAGCAIITTTKAILDAMKALPFYKELYALYEDAIKSIIAMDIKIRKDPAQYFELPRVFGLAELKDPEKKEIAASKEHAISLSAICQAFIDTIGKTTDLAQAQALVKHAQQNSGIRKVMVNWFRDSFKTMGKGKTLTDVLTIATVKVRTDETE